MSLYRLADEQLADERAAHQQHRARLSLCRRAGDGRAARSSSPTTSRPWPSSWPTSWPAICGSIARSSPATFSASTRRSDKAAGLSGPVCLLDMGDNVGGGSPGDGTLLALAIHERKLPQVVRLLCDPEVGRPGRGDRRVGNGHCFASAARPTSLHGPPLECEATVQGSTTASSRSRSRGTAASRRCDQGRTAVVRTDTGLTIMLTSRRMPPFSLRQLTSSRHQPGRVSPARRQGGQRPGRRLQRSLQALHPRQHARLHDGRHRASCTTSTGAGRCFRWNGTRCGRGFGI